MEAKYKVKGLKEHTDALKTLPALMQAAIIRGVLRDAGRIEIQKKVSASLPYGKRRSVAKELKIVNGKNKTSVLVGLTTDEFVARFFEYGTMERETRAGHNRGRISAKPVIETAIDERAKDVVGYINSEFGNRIATHLQRKIKSAKRRNSKA